MIKSNLILLVLSLMLVACDPCDLRYGFPESCFHLAEDSRLPKWFVAPIGYSRDGLQVTCCYYSPPFMKPRAIFKLKTQSSETVLLEKTGIMRYHPESVKLGMAHSPLYVYITVDGIEEVIEHRKLDDIIYIVDDPKLINALKQRESSK